ncbi:sulfurtransferase [Pelagibacterium luteolum]|uniref:Thiosulfate/3-mercaptopyruvate sulfurtransferase n=1 Tax=Pelagibacterium luteolum TaxID=440168 RepID=A0A1G7TN70_9HYPH|nr:sulfurtransferase [Pelagibacterium luteolum]SDG35930.1 thiosulfate/3-mercaptopyruvate sulfurtransferase [Pelagibacterium luteolum]
MRLALTAFAVAATLSAPALAQSEATPLVDAQWLLENAGAENVVVLDIRDEIEGTDLGELPYIANSVVAPYASAGWRTEVQGVPGQIPPVEQVAELIGSLGIDNDDHVVIVPWGTDSSEIGGATRVYWTFKYLGHDEVSILDGGWRQYDAAGGERVAELAAPEAAEFTADVQPELIATTDDVLEALETGVALVDGRPVEQFEGETKSPVVAALGTIPGSVNIPHSEFYSSEYARFAQPETVAALLEAVNVGPDEESIVFCNTGHWASVAWFGLHEILGNENASMYDGSMAEWTADASRPVE